MALDAIKNLQQDDDTNYSPEERDAMKAIDLSDLKAGICDLTNALESGLLQDIEKKNNDFVMKKEMTSFFAASVLPDGAPTKVDGEPDDGFRIKVMKYLLQKALPEQSTLPDGLIKENIDPTNPNLTVNDIIALHYFQLLRHIPGKSKPDAICGPLTMKDLLTANGVDLTTQIKEPQDSVFVKYKETPVILTESEKQKYTIPQDSIKVYSLGDTIISVNNEGVISEITTTQMKDSPVDEQTAESPIEAAKNASSVHSVTEFKDTYFPGMPEVYGEFIKGIGQLTLNDISGAKDIEDIGLFTTMYGSNFFIKQNEDAFELRCIGTQNFAGLDGGGVKLADFDLMQHTKRDEEGNVIFDWNGYKETIKKVIREQITQSNIATEKVRNEQVVADARFATSYNYGYGLQGLFGNNDKKTQDIYYKGFLKLLGGTITLHNKATRLSEDGTQMRYTLGNFDFKSGYQNREYLKRYVAIKDITDANGKFDGEKWKKHLATTIDDCVTKYRKPLQKGTDIAAK